MTLFGKIQKLYSKIIESSLLIAFIALISSSFIVITLSFIFLYFNKGQNLLANILIEAHGMLFDILVIGIFILWLNQKGEARRLIKWKTISYNNEIDDLRGWESEEAARKIRGDILRLNELGITSMDLRLCCLKKMIMTGVKLKNSILISADLTETNLDEADFSQADLSGVKMQSANLIATRFEDAKLCFADLRETFLGLTYFSGADLFGADLRGAYFGGKDKIDELQLAHLCKAKTLYGARLDSVIEKRVKEKSPHLFDEPSINPFYLETLKQASNNETSVSDFFRTVYRAFYETTGDK